MEENEFPASYTDESSTGAIEAVREKTKVYARNFWELISRHSLDLRSDTRAPATRSMERYRYEHKGLLMVLFSVPYLLVALFITSLFWDFDGMTAEWFGHIYRFEGLLKILSVSGLIGFLTNWLAITMLFRPAEKRPILGHGLIPAQKDRIAFRLAQAVSQDLINPEIIKRKIQESKAISRYREQATGFLKNIIDDPEFREELKLLVVSYVDEMIADPDIRGAMAERILEQIETALESKSFERVALKAYTFLRGQDAQLIIEEALNKLPGSVESGLDKVDELLDTLPETIDKNSDSIERLVTSLLHTLINQLDVHSLVENNIRNFEEKRLEKMIKGATNEQLQYIQYLGAVLGTVGGFVIWSPVLSVAILGSLVLAILGLDQLLGLWQHK